MLNYLFTGSRKESQFDPWIVLFEAQNAACQIQAKPDTRVVFPSDGGLVRSIKFIQRLSNFSSLLKAFVKPNETTKRKLIYWAIYIKLNEDLRQEISDRVVGVLLQLGLNASSDGLQ